MMTTTDSLRQQADALLAQIRELPEPSRAELLREVRAKAAGMIKTPRKSESSSANVARLNQRVQAQGGLSEATKAKMAKAQAARREREARERQSNEKV
jgi:hypothetical protein